MIDYRAIYTSDFFNRADGMAEWNAKALKYGDALAAISYAVGYSAFETFREVCGFEELGRDVNDGVQAEDQMFMVLCKATRKPRGVLEIGGGRGEVSVALSYHGYDVQSIEPSPGAVDWYTRTVRQLFSGVPADIIKALTIINKPLPEALQFVDWGRVDTVIMVESLEHIMVEDFAPAYDAIVSRLREVHGRFIITNWIDYHPIAVGQYAGPDVHCRLVDDALYDSFAADAAKTVYRNGSHLVLDY